jgi:hypothetical protein
MLDVTSKHAQACVNGACLEYESQQSGSRGRRKGFPNVDLLGVERQAEVDKEGRSTENDVTDSGVLNDSSNLAVVKCTYNHDQHLFLFTHSPEDQFMDCKLASRVNVGQSRRECSESPPAHVKGECDTE